MNKRGEIVVIVFAIFAIVLTSIGIVSVIKAPTELYVGDKETKNYVDYFICESIAKNISEENIIVFKSKEEAVNGGYNETIGCIK